MKHLLALSFLASSLLAGLHETHEGLFLEVFEKHDPQSRIIAEVSTDKGTLQQLKCRGVRNQEWCKVRYRNEGVVLEGWSDKKSLDILNKRPNTKATFEMRYGGRYAEEGKTLLALKDGFLLVATTESFGAGQKDVYVVKTDKFGNKVWSKTYGGGADDIAEAIIPIEDGYMLAGSTWSKGGDGQNLYVLRISKEGVLRWDNGYYSNKRDRYLGKSLARLNKNHVMVAGSEEHIKFFNGDTYCYLTAIELNGRQKWEQRYGGKNPDRANSIIKVKGGFVFAGETDSWGANGKNMYLVKIDDHGKRVWHRAFGGDFDEVARQVIATADGGYALVGVTNSDHNKLKDVYVVKTDAQGRREWAHHYGGNANDEGFGIVEVADGYVITGYTESTKHLDSELYLLKIDRNGAVIWSRHYGGPADDVGRAIVKVDDGFAITGYSEGNIAKGKELYLLKVDKEGRL